MSQQALGAVNALYPMPTTLVGTHVNGRPNFLAVAHVGILNHGTPQYLSIGLGRIHYTNPGIRESGAFSICLPSEDLMVETDYCGIMTGKNTDKAALFDMASKKYWSLGPAAGKCWQAGKALKKK